MALLRKSKKDVTNINTRQAGERRGGPILGVIRMAHLTEKSSVSADRGAYVFSVNSSVNKHQVKEAVEAKYGIAVSKVRMINLPGKERHRGKQIGWKAGMKKAIVTVAKGQRIEIQ